MKLVKKIITICSFFLLTGVVGCSSNSEESSFVSPTIELSDKKVSISVGQTYQLTATTSETSMKIFWFTRDGDIASVSSSGLVTALSTGSTVCYAQVGSNTAMCSITVTPYEPDDYLNVTSSVSEITLATGDSYNIPLTVKYGDEIITTYTVDYAIENEEIISYSDGIVTGIKSGTSKLLLSINYNNLSEDISFDVTVIE